MRWCSAWMAAVVLLVLAGGAAAQADTTRVEVIVCRISDEPGKVDPRARKLHEKLKDEFRYQSLEVLQVRTLQLLPDQVGGVGLPNGKQAQVRPLQRDAQSVLLAVEVEGAVSTDVRVKNGHLFVIGAGRHEGGKLVISFEPGW